MLLLPGPALARHEGSSLLPAPLFLPLPPRHTQHPRQVSPDLATNAERVACYRGTPLLTSAGPATVKSVAGGGIK